MPKTLFISLAPNVFEESGHGIIYQKCLESAAKSFQSSFIALFPKKSNIQETKTSWSRFFNPNRWFRLIDFCRLFQIKAEKRVFFLETFSFVDFSFLSIASSLFSKKTDLVCLLFRHDLLHLPQQGKLHLFLIRLCKLRLGDRFIMLTDSELIAKGFKAHLKHEMMVLPIPHTDHITSVKVKDEKIVCWWPGPPRPAKGLQDLLHLANLPSRDPLKIELVAAEKSKLPNTTLIADVLTREEYLHYLQQSDFILLPYDADVYKSGTSGIFVETVVAGKIPVVKEGSWLAYELLKHQLPELILEWNHQAFFTDLLNLMDNDQMKRKLAAMRQHYLQFHSQKTFEDSLHTSLCVSEM